MRGRKRRSGLKILVFILLILSLLLAAYVLVLRPIKLDREAEKDREKALLEKQEQLKESEKQKEEEELEKIREKMGEQERKKKDSKKKIGEEEDLDEAGLTGDKDEDRTDEKANEHSRDTQGSVGQGQSEAMLEYTNKPWPRELEETLKDLDFSQFNFDVDHPKQIRDTDSLYVLANKANYFPKNYIPSNLVDPKSTYMGGGDRNQLKKVAADALDALVRDAKNQGYTINNVSAYRSISYQEKLFADYANRHGMEEANRFSSKAGYSEHHTGLCLDVSSPNMGFGLEESYGNTNEGKWLEKNAHKYGFIIRYPRGKENITGYTYEPWHIRYLGVPLASYLYETGLTYEEFLALQLNKSINEIVIE